MFLFLFLLEKTRSSDQVTLPLPPTIPRQTNPKLHIESPIRIHNLSLYQTSLHADPTMVPSDADPGPRDPCVLAAMDKFTQTT